MTVQSPQSPESPDIRAISSEPPIPAHSRFLSIWGVPLTALGLALLAAALVWSRGEMFGLSSKDARISALLWIGCAMVALVLAHFLALVLGAYGMAARLFRRESGDRPQADKPLKHDPPLQYLREELRAAYGWRWRYRMPWLMLAGTDELINEVAPGLKQAGVMVVAGTVLVHAAQPAKLAAPRRRQFSRLRRRRPVDGLVQVVRMGDAIRPDTDQARALAIIAADLRWGAPITLLHPVKATGGQPEQFEAVGAFVASSMRPSVGRAESALTERLTSLENQTAGRGVRQCGAPHWTVWLAEVSAYIGHQRERIVTGWGNRPFRAISGALI